MAAAHAMVAGGGAAVSSQMAMKRTMSNMNSTKLKIKDKLSANAEELEGLFADWDEDGDGTINLEEFRRAVLIMGIRATRDDIKEMFETVDEDGSGSITYLELMDVLNGGERGRDSKGAKKEDGKPKTCGAIRRGFDNVIGDGRQPGVLVRSYIKFVCA